MIDEILQLSRRVDYLEWDPKPSKNSYETGPDDIFMELFIVCPSSTDTKRTKKLLKKKYNYNLSDAIYTKVNIIINRIKDEWTPALRKANLLTLHSSLPNSSKDKIYFEFEDVSKNVLNLNFRKIKELESRLYIQSITLITDLDKFKKENSEIQINKRTKFLIEVKYNREKLIKMSKIEVKDEFLSR